MSIKSQEGKILRAVVVFFLFIFAFLAIVNIWMKKEISTNQPGQQPARKADGQGRQINLPIAREVSVDSKMKIPPSAKGELKNSRPKPENFPETQDNKIIYEPSIKGKILLQ